MDAIEYILKLRFFAYLIFMLRRERALSIRKPGTEDRYEDVVLIFLFDSIKYSFYVILRGWTLNLPFEFYGVWKACGCHIHSMTVWLCQSCRTWSPVPLIINSKIPCVIVYMIWALVDYASDLTVLSIEMSSGDETDNFSRNIAIALLIVLIVSALNSAWQVIPLFYDQSNAIFSPYFCKIQILGITHVVKIVPTFFFLFI